MLVVIYLKESKNYTIIPEEFIYCLDEQTVKNKGLNPNQKRLIYFSYDVYKKLEQNVPQEFVPKFHLPITNMYPLPDGLIETCFNGYMYVFRCKYSNEISVT